MQNPSLKNTSSLLALTLVAAAALSACNGDDNSPVNGTSTDSATTYSADATMISSDATTTLDAGVQTAQAVVSAQATAAATGGSAQAMSLSARPADLVNLPVSCPGGGTATLTITGGVDGSETNGRFDTGEVYTLVYADCKGATGALALNGTLALTVNSATTTDLSLGLVVTNLSATLPRGMVTLAGSTNQTLTSTVDTSTGATLITSAFSSPSMTLSTQFNNRSSTFALTNVDITRQSTWMDGVLQSSSINGTHTLTATLPNASFSYTVATQGGVTYGSDGTPATGNWVITLPNSVVDVSIANSVATITVDDGKDGSIDRSFTTPIDSLNSAAG